MNAKWLRPASGTGYRFLTAPEVAFIEAVVVRLIPNDAVGPGAVEAGVRFFLDRQLARRYGRGDHYFLGTAVLTLKLVTDATTP